jgi:hypothetical protein
MLGYESCRQFRVGLALIAMLATSVATAGDQDFAAVNAWGKLHLFKAHQMSQLMHRTYDAEQNHWSPWVTIAKGQITSAPSALLTDNGTRLAVYFRGPQGKLSQVYMDQGKAWQDIYTFGDRRIHSSPRAVVFKGILSVFAQDQDSQQMKTFYDGSRGNWTNWIEIDQQKLARTGVEVDPGHAGIPDFAMVEAWGKLHSFKASEKGHLMYRNFDAQQKWSRWESISSHVMTSSPTAVLSDEGSRLAIYFRGKDGLLYQVYRDRDSGWSSVWTFRERKLESAPTAVVVNGVLTVFARNSANGLMKIYYDKNRGSWTKWIDVDAPSPR